MKILFYILTIGWLVSIDSPTIREDTVCEESKHDVQDHYKAMVPMSYDSLIVPDAEIIGTGSTRYMSSYISRKVFCILPWKARDHLITGNYCGDQSLF